MVSALLTLCEGNPLWPVDSHHKGPATYNSDFLIVSLGTWYMRLCSCGGCNLNIVFKPKESKEIGIIFCDLICSAIDANMFWDKLHSWYMSALMQKRCNSIADTMELHLFCIKPLIYDVVLLAEYQFSLEWTPPMKARYGMSFVSFMFYLCNCVTV